MSLTKKVFSNFVLQVISRTIALLTGTLIIGLMMRYLGPRDYGYYSISIAFLQVFGIIADFGLYLISLRYLGEADSLPLEKREKRISYLMGNIFSLRLFSAFVFYGGAFALSFLFPYPQAVKIGIGILSGSLFFCTLIQTLSAFYQKMLATQSIFWGEIFGKIITLFLMLFLISRQAGLYLILSSFVYGNFVNFLNKFIFGKYKNHLIILDNAGSHKNIYVKDAILKSNNKYLFSIPYTPKTNGTIEMFFNQIKHYFISKILT